MRNIIRASFLSGYPIPRRNPDPEGKKSRIQGIKIPRRKKIPFLNVVGSFSSWAPRLRGIPGISGFPRVVFGIFESQSQSPGFRDYALEFFHLILFLTPTFRLLIFLAPSSQLITFLFLIFRLITFSAPIF